MASNIQALADYIPAAWRAYQHLGEIRALQARAAPHIAALGDMAPEAKQLYSTLFPQDKLEEPATPPKKSINVKQLQEMLNHYGAHLKVDGIYGDATHKAVEAYQRGHGLTVDGWAGAETLDHLFGQVYQEAAQA